MLRGEIALRHDRGASYLDQFGTRWMGIGLASSFPCLLCGRYVADGWLSVQGEIGVVCCDHFTVCHETYTV